LPSSRIPPEITRAFLLLPGRRWSGRHRKTPSANPLCVAGTAGGGGGGAFEKKKKKMPRSGPTKGAIGLFHRSAWPGNESGGQKRTYPGPLGGHSSKFSSSGGGLLRQPKTPGAPAQFGYEVNPATQASPLFNAYTLWRVVASVLALRRWAPKGENKIKT